MKVVNSEYELLGAFEENMAIQFSEIEIFHSCNAIELSRTTTATRLIAVLDKNLSSHIFNVIRYFAHERDLLLIIGCNEFFVRSFAPSDSVVVFKNKIEIHTEENRIEIIKVARTDPFDDVIKLNCTTSEICFRPQKKYPSALADALVLYQTTKNYSVVAKDGRLWYLFNVSPREFTHYLVEKGEQEYKNALSSFLSSLERIFLASQACEQDKEKLLMELYRYSPFVGFLLNIIAAEVFAYSNEKYYDIILEGSKLYNVDMPAPRALSALQCLKRLLQSQENSCGDIVFDDGPIFKFEKYLFITSVASDLRRKAHGILSKKEG